MSFYDFPKKFGYQNIFLKDFNEKLTCMPLTVPGRVTALV
jgi:hypothetical protein